MNLQKAITTFIERTDHLTRLCLVTDSELLKLYGEEVIMAVSELGKFDREEGVCLRCGGQCCRDIGCELYAPQFNQCPIYEFRPIACRLHFCHLFNAADNSPAVALRDIFLGSLSAEEIRTGETLTPLDIPPLSRCMPEFTTAVVPWIDEVRHGSLSPERALVLIGEEAAKYHISPRSENPGSLPY